MGVTANPDRVFLQRLGREFEFTAPTEPGYDGVEAIHASVKKTGRVLVLHEDTRRGGLGGELAALLMEELFFHLDAPLVRVTAPDTPVPYSPPLEHDFLPGVDDVVGAGRQLLAS